MEETEFDQLAARAKAHRITFTEICQRAEIAASTFRRWRRGEHEARRSLHERAERALDDLIAERKANA